MREFDYEILPKKLLSPEILKLVAAIHEFRGKQTLYLEANVDTLFTLSEVARAQSIEASNRIEGIHTSDKRLAELVNEKTTPKNRDEEEIAGYRDVLATIHESFDFIDPSPSIILQLHRNLYSYTESAFGGKWKSTDNIIAEIGEGGQQIIRFKPTPAVATPLAMDNLYDAYIGSLNQDIHDPLILACMFVFDFICIHPFNDGNGRMSRLLTLLLLYRSGYLVGKYISIEKMVEHSKETYYDALQASSAGWSEGTNDYEPFIRYQLGVIVAAYREFCNRVEGLVVGKKTKAERIEGIFDRKLGKITKKDILEQLPDISAITVERTLSSLLGQGKIKKVGAGRTTGYVKIEPQVSNSIQKIDEPSALLPSEVHTARLIAPSCDKDWQKVLCFGDQNAPRGRFKTVFEQEKPSLAHTTVKVIAKMAQ